MLVNIVSFSRSLTFNPLLGCVEWEPTFEKTAALYYLTWVAQEISVSETRLKWP